jgi:hypothetical protein
MARKGDHYSRTLDVDNSHGAICGADQKGGAKATAKVCGEKVDGCYRSREEWEPLGTKIGRRFYAVEISGLCSGHKVFFAAVEVDVDSFEQADGRVCAGQMYGSVGLIIGKQEGAQRIEIHGGSVGYG